MRAPWRKTTVRINEHLTVDYSRRVAPGGHRNIGHCWNASSYVDSSTGVLFPKANVGRFFSGFLSEEGPVGGIWIDP